MQDSTVHARPQAIGAPGIPTTKEAEGVTEEGASDLTGGAASPSILFGKKKKKKKKTNLLKRKIEREHKQLYDP